MPEQVDVITNDLVDDFCYEIALILRRVLDIGEEDGGEEGHISEAERLNRRRRAE